MQVRIRISRPAAPARAIAVAPPGAVTRPITPANPPGRPALGGSSLVAIGILGSRITGLLRETAIAHYFGLDSIVADAFRQSIRIPNLLSNLLGEGVLSASFVTVYAKLRALHQDDEADDLGAAVFSMLALLCAVLVVVCILLTPALVYVVAPGFKGEKRELTIHIVRILFPSTGFVVMSAWCLGVLNSHRKFLLSYLAPVVLNFTVIVVTIANGRSRTETQLAGVVAWAFVLGNVLTFAVQLPSVLKFLPDFQLYFDWKSPAIRQVMRNFGPVFFSRGVVQVSAFVDSMIASWLPTSAVAAFGYAQIISVLPISLFSMSVSAAELPALSSAVGNKEEVAEALRKRLSSGLRRIAFFIVPSAVAFLVLGDVLAAALFQSGKFSHQDAVYLWGILAGSSVGLLATSLGRLYSSTFYALLDTRTPLRFAIVRVVLTSLLGLLCALELPKWLGVEPKWGVAGLTASAGVAGWLEFALLRRALTQRIGNVSLNAGFTARLWAVALCAALLGYGIKLALGVGHPVLLACAVVPVYGVAYFAGAFLLGIDEAAMILRPLARRMGVRL